MEMLVSREWLRKKISSDPDVETDAGFSVAALENLGMFIPTKLGQSTELDEKIVKLKFAFGVLIRQLRRRDELTISAVSQKARIAEDELRQIEHDPHYLPRPRTVHQLAQYFGLPEREMMKLSGATRTFDKEFQEEAFRFAASADDMSKLTDNERQLVNEYVKYLNEIHDRK